MNKIERAPKEQQLIATAKHLFYKYGIRRVTVGEICQEAQVSKVTFYKYFPNKAELARTFFLETADQGLADYRAIMQQEVPFSQKVKGLIQLKMDGTEDISAEFVKDIFEDESLGVKALMLQKQGEYMAEVLSDFEKAAQAGEMRKDIKPQFILYFLEKIFDMAADEKLAVHYENEQEVIMELTNFFFYGLGVQNENNA